MPFLGAKPKRGISFPAKLTFVAGSTLAAILLLRLEWRPAVTGPVLSASLRGIASIEFRTDSSALRVKDSEGITRAWSLPIRAELPSPIPFDGWTSAGASTNDRIDYSPDRTLLAEVDGHNDVAIRTVQGERLVRTLRFGDVGVLGVAFSPNGRYVAAAGQTGGVTVWETLSGRNVYTYTHPLSLSDIDPEFYRFAFSPDSRFLATAVLSGYAALWDTRNKRRVAIWKAHNGRVTAIAIAPNNRWLATGDESGELRVWTLR